MWGPRPWLALSVVLFVGLAAADAVRGEGESAAAEDAAAAPSLESLCALLVEGRVAEAREGVEGALDAARRSGDRPGEAAALLLRGLVEAKADESEAAVASLEQSVALLEDLGDSLGAWMGLLALGEHERIQDRLDDAGEHFARALVVLAELEASSRPLRLDVLGLLAPSFGMDAGMLKQAEGMIDLVKPILVRFAEVTTRISYAAVLLESGKLEDAERQVTRAQELSMLFGGVFDGSIAMRRGDLRRRQWRLDEARGEYERALAGAGSLPAIPGIPDDRAEIRVLSRLAEIESLRGEADAAVAWNDRALAVARGLGKRALEVDVLQDRARLLLFAGRAPEAEAPLLQALALAEAETDAFYQASVLTDLGFQAFHRGGYEEAAVRLEDALSRLRGDEEPPREARVILEAGVWGLLMEVYSVMGSEAAGGALVEARRAAAASAYPPAEGLVTVLEAWQRFTLGKATVAEVRAAYARFLALPAAVDLHRRQGDEQVLPEIFSVFERGVAVGDPIDGERLAQVALPPFRLAAGFLTGKLMFDDGRYEAARQEWTGYLAETEAAGHHDFAAGAAALIGATYVKEDQSAQAVPYFERAIEHLEASAKTVRVEELLAGYLGSERRVYYAILIEFLARRGETRKAFEYTERARARSLLQMLGNRRLAHHDVADAGLVTEVERLRETIAAWDRRTGLAPLAERGQLAADLAQARRRYGDLLVRLKVSSPEYASIVAVEPSSLDEVQRLLDPGTTLVSYFVGPWSVHAWVVERDAFHHLTLPLDRSELRRAVCWAAGLEARGGGEADELVVPACDGQISPEELYDRLVAPLRPYVRGSRLLIAPHAELHYVPFAALRDRATGRYLVEDATLSYVPSASVLRFLREKETPVEGRAIVLGSPAIDDPELGSLEWAEWEAEAVARRLGVEPLLGPAATKTRVLAAGEVDLLHVAAHGVYEPENPTFSRVLLAAEAEVGDGVTTAAGNGGLSVDEIFSDLDLRGVNLVVLSACRTARGRRGGGDEIVGLTRALLYAGSPGVISTLWGVDDQASALLIDELYRRWTEGVPIANALQEAQVHVLRMPGYSDPYYWAAFSLTGDPQGRWQSSTTTSTRRF